MRTLLISLTLMAVAGAAEPALAQSYERAIAEPAPRYRDQDRRDDSRDGARQGDAYAREQDQRGYDDRQAYPADDGAPRRHHRRPPAAVSRYAGYGAPVYYDDGMIRSGRDWPGGAVGTPAYGVQAQVCTVRRSYYDPDQGRYRTYRRRVPCAGSGPYQED